jgi:hypothetical protein
MMRGLTGVLCGAALLAAGCEAPSPAANGGTGAERVSSAELAPLAARAEAARGLRFVRAVEGWRVRDAALAGILERELDRSISPGEIALDAQLAGSLGLLPRGFDLRAALVAFQMANAGGFYSPPDGRLYIVDGAASAGGQGADALAVHELAHALQAQHSELFAVLLGLRGDDDLGFALTALLEGEATFVELADAAERTGSARPTPAEFAAQFPSAAAVPELPRVLAAGTLAAYPLGYALANGLVARGGTRALGAAYRDPPLTSEELLHPDRYLEGRREPFAELPREPRLASCRALSSSCYGELVVRAWLEDRGASAGDASAAAAGWDADRAWRFDCAAHAASAWLLELEDEREARELERELRDLAPAVDGEALALTLSGARLLVSQGLGETQRGQLLALPAPREFQNLAEILAAHPEILRRGRRARR